MIVIPLGSGQSSVVSVVRTLIKKARIVLSLPYIVGNQLTTLTNKMHSVHP